jgi:hypothetical protein
MDLDLISYQGRFEKIEVGAMHYVFPTLRGAIFDTMAI